MDAGEASSTVASPDEDVYEMGSYSHTRSIGLPAAVSKSRTGSVEGEVDSSANISASYAVATQPLGTGSFSEPVLTKSSISSTSLATLLPGIQDRSPVVPFSSSLLSSAAGASPSPSLSQHSIGCFSSPSLLLTPEGWKNMCCSVPESQHVKLSHITKVTVSQVVKCISTEIMDKTTRQVIKQGYVEVNGVSVYVCVQRFNAYLAIILELCFQIV